MILREPKHNHLTEKIHQQLLQSSELSERELGAQRRTRTKAVLPVHAVCYVPAAMLRASGGFHLRTCFQNRFRCASFPSSGHQCSPMSVGQPIHHNSVNKGRIRSRSCLFSIAESRTPKASREAKTLHCNALTPCTSKPTLQPLMRSQTELATPGPECTATSVVVLIPEPESVRCRLKAFRGSGLLS